MTWGSQQGSCAPLPLSSRCAAHRRFRATRRRTALWCERGAGCATPRRLCLNVSASQVEPVRFNLVAQKYSEDKAKDGGLLGWKRREELNGVFAEAAFKLAKGASACGLGRREQTHASVKGTTEEGWPDVYSRSRSRPLSAQ